MRSVAGRSGGAHGRREKQPMKRSGRNSGFTATELMATVVAASALALSAGIVMTIGYREWVNDTGIVEMQRDATFAVDMMAKAIREANPSTVTVSAGRLDIATRSFYSDGADLMYDPNTGSIGDEVVLVPGRLDSFVPVLVANHGVRIDLSLRDDREQESLSVNFSFRQSP